MKTTESLRRRLEEEAEKSGRTLTHEVEYRLEKSVEKDDQFGGTAAVAILDQLGKFLQIYSVSSNFEESFGRNELARAALKVAFEKIVDAALPIDGGLMRAPYHLAPGEMDAHKTASLRIADAILANAMLKQFASLRGKAGDLAPTLEEGVADWAKRTDFWKRTADGSEFSPDLKLPTATKSRSKRKT